LLEADEVVHADPGDEREFFTAKARGVPIAARG
jgi:hypothetical protein